MDLLFFKHSKKMRYKSEEERPRYKRGRLGYSLQTSTIGDL
jgi:hypothetical protein